MSETSLTKLQNTLDGMTPDPARAARACVAAGFQVLNVGRHRVVVELSDAEVAKLAWQSAGLADNLIEARLWERADERLRALLCPALGLLHGGVLLQRRCVPIPGTAAVDEIVADLATHGISDAGHNLGVLGDRVVVYDYALVAPRLARDLLREPGDHRFADTIFAHAGAATDTD